MNAQEELAAGQQRVGRKPGQPKGKRIQARRREAGLCQVCGVRPLVNKSHCRECTAQLNDHKKLRVQRWKTEGRCRNCGKERREGRLRCAECAARVYAVQVARIVRLADAGLCVQCGKGPVAPSLLAADKAMQKVCVDCYVRRIAQRRLKNTALWPALLARLEEQSWRCAYTGEELLLGVNDSVDHIYPVSRFPERLADPANIEWTTREINIFKGAYTRDEFLRLVRFLAGRHPGPGELELPRYPLFAKVRGFLSHAGDV